MNDYEKMAEAFEIEELEERVEFADYLLLQVVKLASIQLPRSLSDFAGIIY